ncbi:hypothetical protein FGB62_169g42 [Gracilaria domingensis]|nr:hypothetical protein FGB62_169g42 [Gracilaria domingensis]
MDPGLSPEFLNRLLAVVGLVFVALLTAGGFAFEGTTIRHTQSIYVGNKVVPATAGNYVEFRNHISPDRKFVSATFLLLSHARCLDENYYKGVWNFALYARMNNLDNLSDVKWPQNITISNSTCVWSAGGFKEEILMSWKFEDSKKLFNGCYINFREVLSEFPKNETKQMQVPEEDDYFNCSFRILSMWCSYYWAPRCAASFRTDDDLNGFMYLSFRQGCQKNQCFSYTRREIVWSYRANDISNNGNLKQMAFLADFFYPSRKSTWLMVFQRVQANSTVQRISERNVTLVKARLFTVTFGAALAIFLGLKIVCFALWFRIVWLKGRRGYNGFVSNGDALSCAVQQVLLAGHGIKNHDKGKAVVHMNGVVLQSH